MFAKMKMTIITLCLVCALPIFSEQDSGDFFIFWAEFRSFVLAKDFSQLKVLSKFPLKTRGPLDSDPVVQFDQAKFSVLMKNYFNQMSGQDPNNLKETEFDLIRKTQNPNMQDMNEKKTEFRIGNAVFQKRKGKWFLTFLYLEEPTYDLLKE